MSLISYSAVTLRVYSEAKVAVVEADGTATPEIGNRTMPLDRAMKIMDAVNSNRVRDAVNEFMGSSPKLEDPKPLVVKFLNKEV